jgi:hypothetical protein
MKLSMMPSSYPIPGTFSGIAKGFEMRLAASVGFIILGAIVGSAATG